MRPMVLRESRPVQTLFAQTRFAWVWLGVRLYLGWQWLAASWRLMEDPRWMQSGAALGELWERALRPPPTEVAVPADGWYSALLAYMLRHEWYAWIAPAMVVAEVVVSIALILGILVGLAAFGGVLLSLQLPLGATVAANPLVLTLAILLMFAWKTAGWIGFDRWLLSILGALWGGRVLSGSLTRTSAVHRDPGWRPAERDAG